MNDIFKKSPRRLRKEKKKRDKERQEQKKQLENLNKIYSNRQSKVRNMKRMEQNKSFQQDFKKMKSLLINPKPIQPSKKRPMDNMMKDYDVFNKQSDFFKTKNKNQDDDFLRL